MMKATLYNSKKYLLVLIGCGFFSTPNVADSSFESWKKQQQSSFVQVKDEFKEYRSELDAAFREYRRKTSAVWGKDNVDLSKKRWVSYIDSLNQRSVVDFEQGTVNVEVAAVNADENKSKKQLEQTLLKAMQQGNDRRPMPLLAAQPVAQPDNKPVLQGQIGMADGAVASEEDYKKLAQDAAANAKKKTVVGDDGKTRVVYQAQLRLVPDHIRVRARKFQPLVNKYAAAYKLPGSIVFAVMETESMFNPTARSAAPAFGLMQLVPTSGARDAYRYVFKKDKVVSDTYLYNPENNVRLGSAYLRRLNSGYLSGIKNNVSRMYATIAAYNTGAGNVFRTFAGKYNKRTHGSYSKYKTTALYQINRLTPDQFYQKMRLNLPYKETRHYIKKVTDRIAKYEAS